MTAISQLPRSTKAIILRKSQEQRKPRYHDTVLEETPLSALQKGQILVKIGAAGFNRREVWIRQGLYPGIQFGGVMGADGAGTVIASSDSADPLLSKRVFFVPFRGWESHPDAPESRDFCVVGGTDRVPFGTFSEYAVVDRNEVIPTPDHLDDVHAAAWPVGGVTAWRATMVNARVQMGDNILITGIGGGVALLAMQLCLAKGANVYVTSGSADKINKAVSFGAKGGVNYKDNDWPDQLEKMLKQNISKNSRQSAELDAVVDSGGGDIMPRLTKVLKQGGRVVVYGMTASPMMPFTMREVLKNQQLIGSTMGSRKDLIDATNFLAEHRIFPIVSHTLDGLEAAEEGFELLRRGEQFGKVVIKMKSGSRSRAKL